MTEGAPDSWFQQLTGTLPTDKQKVALLTLQKRLGLRDDDPLWSVFVALEHYQSLYERIPEKIATASSFAVEQVYSALERSTESFRRRIESEIAEALMDQVERTAVDRANAARRWATAASGLVLSLLVVVAGAGGYAWGRSAGEQTAKADGLWAQLPSGRYAKKIDNSGVITDLMMCRSSNGDFRIPSEGGVICETKDHKVHSRGVPAEFLAPE